MLSPLPHVCLFLVFPLATVELGFEGLCSWENPVLAFAGARVGRRVDTAVNVHLTAWGLEAELLPCGLGQICLNLGFLGFGGGGFPPTLAKLGHPVKR